ncbi:metal ABC transporter ATP-binding protein [Albibacterium indicum]|uniref:metal ABC transporter ATP-binding protein n=1 Tax=Albibacterium indicum TaxID=2292082 RepID=UPI000E536F56|nr:metal ABC transporter ATP-binding protein [Pedobacter indicus]
MKEQKTVLKVNNLTVGYTQKPVLWGIDFSIPQGSIVGVIGPNGAGKSTLLKSIMSIIPISSGSVELFGSSLDEVRHRVSYVPQRESVDWDFPASAYDVVMMGRFGKLGLLKRPGHDDKQIVNDCLEKVGMMEFSKRQISQLSGGQQQRVFIARALAQQADFYLLDEPFAGVDAATEKTIIELLRNMAKENKTVMVVHHDLQSVKKYFDWTVLLNVNLIASGKTEEVFTEENIQRAYGGKLTLLSDVRTKLGHSDYTDKEG